ncbi:MAG: hypothetical protein HYW47_03230 [Deltaproteobacteria bacterium]|nr:hypothetical protein [Deltaproteobacteria bacterium]
MKFLKSFILIILAVYFVQAQAFSETPNETTVLWERYEYGIPLPKGGYVTSSIDIGYTLDYQNNIQKYFIHLPHSAQKYEETNGKYAFPISVRLSPELLVTCYLETKIIEKKKIQIKVQLQQTDVVYTTLLNPKIEWKWRPVKFTLPWPDGEGLLQTSYIGFLVKNESEVLAHAIFNNNGIYDSRMIEGPIRFQEHWKPLGYQFNVLVETDRNYWHITVALLGHEGVVSSITGFLPLTQEEKIEEVILLSKTQNAADTNTAQNVSDKQLAQAIIFAARSYDIPLHLFVALLFQESRFNVAPYQPDSQFQGIAQMGKDTAKEELDNKYFAIKEGRFLSRDFQLRYQNADGTFNANIKPSEKKWIQYQNNLLYGAAYLRFIFEKTKTAESECYMPGISQEEMWKFVLVFYNLGHNGTYQRWIDAERPNHFNKSFVDQLPLIEEVNHDIYEKVNYAASVYFFKTQLDNKEPNLIQFLISETRDGRASLRSAFIKDFNNKP